MATPQQPTGGATPATQGLRPVKDFLKESLLLVDAADGMFFRKVGESLSFGGIDPGGKGVEPFIKDVGGIYDACFTHRREIAIEVNHCLRNFERREAKASNDMNACIRATDESLGLIDPCKDLMKERLGLVVEHVNRVSEVTKMQLLRDEHWEAQREAAEETRAKKDETERADFLKRIQQRQHNIENWTAQQSAALRAKYPLAVPQQAPAGQPPQGQGQQAQQAPQGQEPPAQLHAQAQPQGQESQAPQAQADSVAQDS